MMKKTLLVITVYLLAVTSPVFADGMSGLFIANRVKDTTAYENWHSAVLPVLKAHQCTSLRKGQLLGGEGSLQWDRADQFSLLTCQAPVLAELVKKGHYSALVRIADHVSMIEGDLNVLSDSEPPISSEYIIKISHFNNLETAIRNESLSQIGTQATKIDESWINDAILTPTASIGLIQPDDLTFIYYPKAGQGSAFRKNNPDMMKKIGAFNQEHVTRFIYLNAPLKK